MNIQQFATALDTGRALQVCQDQMKGLQSQIDMLKEQMDKLTAAPSTAEGQGDGSAKEAM
jgi:prefoldin subunit 5